MTATTINDLVMSEINGVVQTRYEHFVMKLPKFVKHMRTVGESGVLKVKSDTSPKLKDKGIA